MVLREEGRRLTGRVESDDAYLGGEHPGGKPGIRSYFDRIDQEWLVRFLEHRIGDERG